MARLVGLVLVALAAWHVSVPAQQPPPQTFRSGVDLVRVDAVVLDRLDKPVHGLREADFQVFEDGKPMPIQSFTEVAADAGETDGRLVAILLDDATVNPVLAVRVKDIARGFVERMGPRDEVGVIMLNGSTGRTTRDRAALLEAIDRYQPGIQAPPGMGIRWGEHTLDTIVDLSKQLAEAEHPRKILVCIGPAPLFNMSEPMTGGFDVRPSWFDAVRAAARYNLSVYVIDPNGLEGMIGTADTAGLARETGGQTFMTNLFDKAVDRIWREAGNYYLLGYAATPERSGAHTRRITVKTTRRDVTVRARRAIG